MNSEYLQTLERHHAFQKQQKLKAISEGNETLAYEYFQKEIKAYEQIQKLLFESELKTAKDKINLKKLRR